MSACQTCEKPLRRDNRTGYCAAHHHHKGPPPPTRHCDCGAALSHQNTTGRCKTCNTAWLNSDPAIRERRVAAIVETFQTDEYKAAASAGARRSWRNPETRAKRLANFDPHRFQSKGVVAALAPEAKAKRARSVSETRMAWCPPQYRDEARRLNRSSKMPAAEVRRVILARVEQDRLSVLRFYASDAADFISRHDRCAVIRLDAETWRYGNARKSVDDILRMAQRKGWQPMDAAA